MTISFSVRTYLSTESRGLQLSLYWLAEMRVACTGLGEIGSAENKMRR